MLTVAHPGRGMLCCQPGMCWLTVEGHNASLPFCCTFLANRLWRYLCRESISLRALHTICFFSSSFLSCYPQILVPSVLLQLAFVVMKGKVLSNTFYTLTGCKGFSFVYIITSLPPAHDKIWWCRTGSTSWHCVNLIHTNIFWVHNAISYYCFWAHVHPSLMHHFNVTDLQCVRMHAIFHASHFYPCVKGHLRAPDGDKSVPVGSSNPIMLIMFLTP